MNWKEFTEATTGMDSDYQLAIKIQGAIKWITQVEVKADQVLFSTDAGEPLTLGPVLLEAFDANQQVLIQEDGIMQLVFGYHIQGETLVLG
ncbi:MAG: hypothetical protein LBT80_00625 [Lactobacillaceae bacterium]|jgi:hypothetical protein|nr:hypothetical protein [Lactobacillaceae bacterium]